VNKSNSVFTVSAVSIPHCPTSKIRIDNSAKSNSSTYPVKLLTDDDPLSDKCGSNQLTIAVLRSKSYLVAAFEVKTST